MRVERDVPIAMSDGVALRANVFRPDALGEFPVILSHGPYTKGVHFRDWRPSAWKTLTERNPDVLAGSSGLHMNWETVDPERWVPYGYAVVRVDARGSGRSPGTLEIYSPRDRQDMYETIEWAGEQPWSTGKVGLVGISYYAIAQWRVASIQPPHLAAIIPWEGWADNYRDRAFHGGILSNNFISGWIRRSIEPMQHGSPDPLGLDPVTGELPTGPEIMDEETLRANRVDFMADLKQHPLDDGWHRERSADWDKITVPLLSCGNWGGVGLHLRGNIEGFAQAASDAKWLEVHTGTHWEDFYVRRGMDLQKRFLDRFLKGADNGWDDEPPVLLAIRRPDSVTYRKEHEWPLARTEWTRLYLHGDTATAGWDGPGAEGSVSYDALGDGVTFLSAPFDNETEFTGPAALRLWASSSTADMDVFATVRAFDPQGNEVTFVGASEPRVPLTQGWLRASHRELDEERSTDYRPYHAHRRVQPLTPGEPVALDVEIWPTSFVFPAGYRLGLTISGRDFQRPGREGSPRGSGPFLHTDPDDRDPAVFGGRNTLHTGGATASYLLLPRIPA
jgi:uncharacterized protein